MSLLYEYETYSIIGAAIEVHKELGAGFLESVYQEALEKEFILREIPFKREASINIFYKGEVLRKTYIADFICYDKIILELKALSALTNEHFAQILNYLIATQTKIGLLINFGKNSLEHKRIINENNIRDNPRKSADQKEVP
ncbi:MAG: GxxExxY protein [Spirochaetaceae bacterium]|jgi:GxxExxY protein|nr:GxxExxY protein [Spirochaetaceae bacterium]